MITAEKHLDRLVDEGKIEESDALRWANSHKDFLMEREHDRDSDDKPD